MKPQHTVLAMSLGTVLLCGLMVVSSHYQGAPANANGSSLLRIMPASSSLLLSTAVALALANYRRRWPSLVLAGGVSAMCMALLLSYGPVRFMGNTTDSWGDDAFPAGFPSLLGAFAIACIAVGIGCVVTRRRTLVRLGHVFALGAGAIGTFVIIAYICGARSLYSFSPDGHVSFATAAAIALLSIGVLSVRPRFSLVRVFYLSSEAGRLARGLLPFVFGTPVLLALLMVYGLRLGWYSVETGMALLVTALVGMLGAMTWRYALNVSAAEARLDSLVRSRTQRLSDTVAELEEFSQALAHDVRGPLINLREFLGLVLDDEEAPLAPIAREHVERAMRAANRINGLTLAMLRYGELSRRPFRLESLDVEAAVHAVTEELRATAQAGLEVSVMSPLAHVWGDVRAMREVMRELLNNACRFAHPERLPRVTIWSESSAATVRLSIRDDGIGIKPEFHERIFHPFEQLARAENHLGIGLAMVKRAVTKMNGHVGVISDGMSGSTFWLELPRGPQAPPAGIEASSDAGRDAGASNRNPLGPRLHHAT